MKREYFSRIFQICIRFFQEIQVCSDEDAPSTSSSVRGRKMPENVDKVERVRDEVT